MLHGLYILTSSQTHSHQYWPEFVEQSILGGASVIQLREKKLSDEDLLPYALSIQDICKTYNIPFIVNDRITLARQIKADGVHIGMYDNPLRRTREYLGNRYLIGVSCYKNLHSAILAQKMGADYVAFGSVFPSSTKKFAPRCPLSVIRKAKNILDIPICAIGGINLQNIHHIITARANLMATTHSVFDARDPKTAANKLYQQVIMHR